MPFRYRLQRILDFRIRKKDEQLQNVIRAQNEVFRIEGLIEQNNQDIFSTRVNMRKADPMMLDSYDKFLKSLYDKGEQLEQMHQSALQALEVEKQKLIECEKEVKVLEKHKERAKEIYLEEERQLENKTLSEVAVQKYYAKNLEKIEQELKEEELRMLNEEE